MVISADLLKHIKENKGVVLVAGRPGVGKSTFIMEMVRDLTSENLSDVAAILLYYTNYYGYTQYCIFDDEMDVRKGKCSCMPSIWQNFLQSNPQIEIVYDESLPNSQYVFERVIKYLSATKGIKYILIDGLRDVPAKMEKPVKYWWNGSYLSSCLSYLNELAERYDITIIVEHAPDRDLEQRNNKRPGIADLMLKTEVLSDVNSVIMLYRESYYNHDLSDNIDLEVQEIKLKKNYKIESLSILC
jgi:replicative DNA helicase